MIAIGNGESRQNVDIGNLYGRKIGCNSAFQDIDLDYLVCIDKGPLRSALDAELVSTKIWTRPEYAISNCLAVPDVPQGNQRPDQARHWGSGPYSVLIAASLDREIHMIGFDLYSKNDRVNNVYKGQTHYSAADSHAIDPRYWIYQISRVFQEYKDKYFVVYNTEDWIMPDSWCLTNLEFKTLDSIRSTL